MAITMTNPLKEEVPIASQERLGQKIYFDFLDFTIYIGGVVREAESVERESKGWVVRRKNLHQEIPSEWVVEVAP